MPVWEYQVKSVEIAERWSAKRQAQEIANLESTLNEFGADATSTVA